MRSFSCDEIRLNTVPAVTLYILSPLYHSGFVSIIMFIFCSKFCNCYFFIEYDIFVNQKFPFTVLCCVDLAAAILFTCLFLPGLHSYFL